MNELKKNWFPIICIVCGIIMVVACIFAIKYAAEIKELKSEIGQAYFIEKGTVISASEEKQILSVKLDRGDIVSAEVWSLEVKAGCKAKKWHLKGERIAILWNKAENEYVVLTIWPEFIQASTGTVKLYSK